MLPLLPLLFLAGGGLLLSSCSRRHRRSESSALSQETDTFQRTTPKQDPKQLLEAKLDEKSVGLKEKLGGFYLANLLKNITELGLGLDQIASINILNEKIGTYELKDTKGNSFFGDGFGNLINAYSFSSEYFPSHIDSSIKASQEKKFTDAIRKHLISDPSIQKIGVSKLITRREIDGQTVIDLGYPGFENEGDGYYSSKYVMDDKGNLTFLESKQYPRDTLYDLPPNEIGKELERRQTLQ